MINFFKNLFNFQIDPLEDYSSILEQIVKWILIALVIAGTPATTIGVIEAIHLHQPQSALLYIALFLPVIILLILRKRFSYKVSAFIIVSFIFLLGFQNTFVYGFSGAGIPLFLTFFMLVTLFYGLKAGLFSVLPGIVSLAVIGHLMVTEKIAVQVDLMHITTLPVSWLTATSTLVLLGLLMVLSYSFVHYNLLNAIGIAKWHAKKLSKSNAALKKEITKKEIIQKELIKAKNKAEESDMLKSAFLANMSHEIRTPMNGILGFTNLLQEQDLTGEQRQKYIDIIKRSGNRMLNTVNDLIDISRIETGQVEVAMDEIDVQKELESLYFFFLQEAEYKGLQLIFTQKAKKESVTLKTDRSKFTSIVSNLIKNAVKYTREGTVKFGYKMENNSFFFYIEDTGIGIPENRQEAVFNRFVQADIADKEAYEGSGLGLAITKAYVNMLGGEISVQSEVGSGSTFRFSLPQ